MPTALTIANGGGWIGACEARTVLRECGARLGCRQGAGFIADDEDRLAALEPREASKQKAPKGLTRGPSEEPDVAAGPPHEMTNGNPRRSRVPVAQETLGRCLCLWHRGRPNDRAIPMDVGYFGVKLPCLVRGRLPLLTQPV
jgi:hypothetical protein